MTNDEILHELGFINIDEAAKDEIVENVRTTVELRVIGIITELMTDVQKATFSNLQQQGNDQVIWDWLRTEIVGVDVSEVYEATLKDYIEQRQADEFITQP